MDWEKFFDKFGLPGLILVGLYMLARFGIAAWKSIELERIKVQDKQADANIAVLTSLGGKIDNHHNQDIDSHSEMSESLASLHTKLDVYTEITPVRGVPRQEGPYGPIRPKTNPGGSGGR